jgi:hypothetical protein
MFLLWGHAFLLEAIFNAIDGHWPDTGLSTVYRFYRPFFEISPKTFFYRS